MPLCTGEFELLNRVAVEMVVRRVDSLVGVAGVIVGAIYREH